jgi:hypothetical protein
VSMTLSTVSFTGWDSSIVSPLGYGDGRPSPLSKTTFGHQCAGVLMMQVGP